MAVGSDEVPGPNSIAKRCPSALNYVNNIIKCDSGSSIRIRHLIDPLAAQACYRTTSLKVSTYSPLRFHPFYLLRGQALIKLNP